MFKYLRNYYLSTFLLTLLSLGLNPVAHAQEEEKTEAQTPVEAMKQSLPKTEKPVEIKAGPKLKELEEYTAVLLNGLEPAQAQYIYNIRQQYGVIRSVQVVRKDVEKAVGSCGNENPDLKTAMDERYEGWNSAILPKLAVADAALKDAVQRQSFRPTVRVSMLLDHVQAAFEERDEKIKKMPVTSAEACQNLLKSMDTTEENLQTLMDETISTLNTMSPDPEKTAAVQEDDKDSEAQQ